MQSLNSVHVNETYTLLRGMTSDSPNSMNLLLKIHRVAGTRMDECLDFVQIVCFAWLEPLGIVQYKPRVLR